MLQMQEISHFSSQCKRKFCNYCKATNHVISECRKRPENRNPRAYHATTPSSNTASLASVSSSFMPSQSSSSSTAALVTPEMIQQMILHTFSTLGISGKNASSSSLWYVDSNHMTFSSTNLSNIQQYLGKLQVHTTDGNKLSIALIGYVPHSLPLPIFFFFLLIYLPIYCPLVNLLTIIVMSRFLLLIVWYTIRSQGR